MMLNHPIVGLGEDSTISVTVAVTRPTANTPCAQAVAVGLHQASSCWCCSPVW